MAKFHGKIGYAQTTQTAPGVYTEGIIERDYYGDTIQNRSLLRAGVQVNPDNTSGQSISIVADAFAREQYFAIRYVEWAGVRWTVHDVEVQHPRLILRLGEVYDGLTPAAPDAP